MTDQQTRPGLSRGTIPILATASGIAVSNIYFVQPLLHAIAQGLEVSDRSAGLVATAAQIGYALGISMVVPLADTANLRRLTTILLSVTAAALLAGAAAPGVPTLALATFVLATTTVLPQIVLPTVTAMSASSAAAGAPPTCWAAR
jgi:predicted MFS family arabinose efflux permease